VSTRRELPGVSAGAGLARGIAFSPDGRLLATTHEDGSVKLWDASDGALLVTHRGHRGAALGVAFLTDGRRLLTAAADGTVKVWPAPAR
jgi:WD40 repeat protein